MTSRGVADAAMTVMNQTWPFELSQGSSYVARMLPSLVTSNGNLTEERMASIERGARERHAG